MSNGGREEKGGDKEIEAEGGGESACASMCVKVSGALEFKGCINILMNPGSPIIKNK